MDHTRFACAGQGVGLPSSMRAFGMPVALVAATTLLGACPIEVEPVQPPTVIDGTPDPVCETPAPGPVRLKLLTRAELGRTLRDLLGVDETVVATLPAENSLLGYENDAVNHQMSAGLLDETWTLMEQLASQTRSQQPTRVVLCDRAATDDVACGEMLVRGFGRRAFRRPLTTSELERFDGLFRSSLTAWGFDRATELVVAALLTSPQFLYRPDLGGSNASEHGLRLVSGFEMASRLSYFLWGTQPDDELLAQAEAGTLDTAEGVAASATAMMADARARDGVETFFRQWLGLDELNSIIKDTAAFPGYDNSFNARWRSSVLHFVDDIMVGGDGSLSSLFTSDRVFLDESLAPVYNANPDLAVSAAGFAAFSSPDGPRAGLLSQPGLMAMLANPDQNSPIRRGVFVRERLLCQPISPPPPDLMVEAPNPDPNLTTRERFAVHTENESCANCHVLIDPIGFGFEHYDALGRYRSAENGLPVDATGELLYTGDEAVEGTFNGALELSQKLAQSQSVQHCAVDNLFRYAMGRRVGPEDGCVVEDARNTLRTTGNLRETWMAIARSEAFRTTTTGVAP
jgi:hypothetical protein